MNAKEMFEKLDMEQEKTDKCIEYHFKDDIDYPYGYYGYIAFDLGNKKYNTNLVDTKKYDNAINQQIKELGWYE